MLWSFFDYLLTATLLPYTVDVGLVVCPGLGDVERLIGSSEGGLSVPALDIKQHTPVGDRTPTSARSYNNKGKNSAGKRGELVCPGSGYHTDLVAPAQALRDAQPLL